MTSQQVASSLNLVKNYPIGQYIPYTIKSAVADGTYAVKVTTAQPDPVLTRELTEFWIWDTSDTKTPNNPVNGTGPYQLKPGTKLNKNSLQLVADNSYHGGKPSVKRLDFSFYQDGSALDNALKQNKIDIADLTADYASVPQATKDGSKLLNVLAPTVYMILPNTIKPGPLQNIKVRQAIYMTLNPATLEKDHYGDMVQPQPKLFHQAYPALTRA